MDQPHFNEEQGNEERGSEVLEPVAEQAPQAQDVGFVGRLFGIIYAPGKSFAVINGKWEWLIVTFLLLLVGFGALPMQKPYLLPDLKRGALENIEKAREQLGEEKYLEIREQIETGMEENFQLTPKTALYGFLARVVSVVVIGLICWVVGNFMFGGKAKFWQVLTIVAFAGIISLIHDYIRGGQMVMNGTSYVYLGLGLLKPEPDSSFLFYFLRQMEFITMWKIAAMSVALGALYRMSAAKFVYVIAPAWLLFSVLVAAGNLFAGGAIVF